MEWSSFFPEVAKILIGGGVITIFYTIQSQKREHDKLQRELFREFNERYDKLNSLLYEMKNKGYSLEHIENKLDEETLQRYIKALHDYFNLCSKEYFGLKNDELIEAYGNPGKQE